MTQHHHHHHAEPDLDGLQLFFLAVCVFDLAFFLFYLFVYELDSQSMISDTLFSTPEYAIVLSITLALRMLGGAMFLYRYRDVYPLWEYVGFVGICITLFGWGWLVAHQDNVNHFSGVALFCLGSVMYSLAFLRLAGKTHEHLRWVHQALRWFLLLSSMALVATFVILWAIEETKRVHTGDAGVRNAYIVEHVAYITQILFYATFILYHTPNPEKPVHVVRPSYHSEEQGPQTQGEDTVPLVQLVHISTLNRL